MYGLSINGKNVNSVNVANFGLNLRFKSEIADIYSSFSKKKKGNFIIHVKKPDLYAKNNSYLLEKKLTLPSVDWIEIISSQDFDENVNYIKERLL